MKAFNRMLPVLGLGFALLVLAVLARCGTVNVAGMDPGNFTNLGFDNAERVVIEPVEISP
jgi:hypothetical protein